MRQYRRLCVVWACFLRYADGHTDTLTSWSHYFAALPAYLLVQNIITTEVSGYMTSQTHSTDIGMTVDAFVTLSAVCQEEHPACKN